MFGEVCQTVLAGQLVAASGIYYQRTIRHRRLYAFMYAPQAVGEREGEKFHILLVSVCKDSASVQQRQIYLIQPVPRSVRRFFQKVCGTDFVCIWQTNKKEKAMYFLWYLLIGLAAGWIANLIVKGSGSGLVVNLARRTYRRIAGRLARFVVRLDTAGHGRHSSNLRYRCNRSAAHRFAFYNTSEAHLIKLR